VRSRALVALLALAIVGVQPLAGSPLAIRALAFLHGHEHAVSVHADAGHVDLVLSHGEDHDHAHDGHPQAASPRSLAERDHVVHLAGDDVIAATLRGGTAKPAPPPLPLSHEVSIPAPAVARVVRAAPEARARGAHHVRTVLRL
jgi:hypothetical protein